MVQRTFSILPENDQTPQANICVRVDKSMSLINHQLFRQSRNYCVKVDLDHNQSDGRVYDVYALNNTWMLRNAYKEAYKIFKKNSQEEEASLKTKARWNDFRVDHGLSGIDDTRVQIFSPPGGPDLLLSTGEYIFTEVHDTSGNARTFKFTGTGTTSEYNIVDQYDIMGNTDATPSDTLSQIAYDDLEDSMDDGQADHLSDDGNLPPYNRIGLYNDVFVKVGVLGGTNGAQKLSTGYFDAPAGLIILIAQVPTPPFPAGGKSFITISCKEGKYKGIHAPNMLE